MKVLDTNVLLHGPDFTFEDAVVPPKVTKEVKTQDGRTALKLCSPRILEPDDNSCRRVQQEVEESNYSFSQTDIHVVALGLMLEAEVVSDDKPVRGLCEKLGVENQGFMTSSIEER